MQGEEKKEEKRRRRRACGEKAERRSFLKVKYISRSNAKQSLAGGNGGKEAQGHDAVALGECSNEGFRRSWSCVLFFFVVIYSEVLSLAATGDERMDGGPSGIAGTTGYLGLRSGRRVHGLARDEAAQEPAYLGVVVIPGGRK